MLRFPLLVLAFSVVAAFGQGAPADSARHNPYQRIPRHWAITGEAGWNGLGGIGPEMHYYILPQLAVDAALGLSSSGVKSGARLRYNFSQAKLAPFAGLGLMHTGGTGGRTVKVEDADTKQDIEYKLEPNNYGQFTLGIDFMAHNGFLFLAAVGYTQAFEAHPEKVQAGVPSDKMKDVFRLIYGSGMTLSFDFGYAF